MLQLDQRVVITKPVSFHDGGAAATIEIDLPAGVTGKLNEWVIVKLDETFFCLAEWDNCVTFDTTEDFNVGVGMADDFLREV